MSAPRDSATLAECLPALAGRRVLVLGDVMLDLFVNGTVARVSPEAPVPVLRVGETTAMLGGAGNVLRNLAALGCEGRLIAAVGDDAEGVRVGDLVAEAGASAEGLIPLPARPTTVKTRYLAGAQQLLRSDVEDTRPLPDAARRALVSALRAALPDADVLVISDYGKGVLDPPTLAEVLAAANAAGVPAVVDPKGTAYGRYRGARVVTPNQGELAAATGLPTGADAEAETAARALADEIGASPGEGAGDKGAGNASGDGAGDAGRPAILATRGPRGMTLVDGDAPAHHLPAAAREVFDVSGAGDTVVAVLAAGLAGGLPLADAARLANAAAGLVVGKVGTATVRPDELAAALHAERRRAADDKVASTARATEQAAIWRRAGLCVGFTNGCFDLLHPGHIHLLRQARAACDRLIVGLNADESVRRLKGPDRPVQDETARATVLASLASVDLVVLFDADTPYDLIAAVTPDVLVKGADYSRDAVVGADLVAARGGRVVLADLADGHSTTRTLDRLRG